MAAGGGAKSTAGEILVSACPFLHRPQDFGDPPRHPLGVFCGGLLDRIAAGLLPGNFGVGGLLAYRHEAVDDAAQFFGLASSLARTDSVASSESQTLTLKAT